MYQTLAAISALLVAVRAQQTCDLTAETHPSMTWSKCSTGGSCTTVDGSVVIDANWRWTHALTSTTNCYTGNTWDATLCPNDAECAANCCLDGADYEATYGVTTSGDSLSIQLVTFSEQENVGARLYLMESNTEYEEFTLLGNEFTFDVDVSELVCGLNGALYFVSMAADGGLSQYPTNKAGAQYGTGYCDSQCPTDLKFINGEANVDGWTPSANNANTGTGGHGSCCSEMDIWEANSISEALTLHPCETTGQLLCDVPDCGGTYANNRNAGECDPDGCDWNPYRLGNTTFYGPGSGFKVDTTKTFTVVTQFEESGGSLSSVNRFYIQNGVTIQQPNADNIPGYTGNSLTPSYCSAEETTFGDMSFSNKGGWNQVNSAVSGGMVLVMSLWDDYDADMLWLDSTYPTNDTASTPGAARGSCSTSSGAPATVESQNGNAKVTFSNIRFGPIGSTTSGNSGPPGGGGSSSSSSIKHTSTSTAPPQHTTTTAGGGGGGATQTEWGQCGGSGYSGPTKCVSGTTCETQNPYYAQCLP